MFFNLLYNLGYLPQIVQLIILIGLSIISFFTLRKIKGYEVDPLTLIIGFYFLRRLFEWIVSFKINDWTIPFLIIFAIALLVFMVRKIKFIGIIIWILIARLLFIFNGQLTMFYGAMITVVAVFFLKPLLNLSIEKVLIFISIGALIGFWGGSIIGIETLILAELFTRCVMNKGAQGVVRFLGLFICIFTSAYFIELGFAHANVILFILVIIWLISKAIG